MCLFRILTKCQQIQHFAFHLIFRHITKIEKTDATHTFRAIITILHISQTSAETQHFGGSKNKAGMSFCKEQLAKQPFQTRKTDFSSHRKPYIHIAEKQNAAWRESRCSILRRPTLPAEKADAIWSNRRRRVLREYFRHNEITGSTVTMTGKTTKQFTI